jgi:hypothetical protein
MPGRKSRSLQGFYPKSRIAILLSMSVEELEKAVAKLPPDQFASFREWFEAFAADEWDRQFEADVKAGKFDELGEEALAAHAAGKTKPL